MRGDLNMDYNVQVSSLSMPSNLPDFNTPSLRI